MYSAAGLSGESRSFRCSTTPRFRAAECVEGMKGVESCGGFRGFGGVQH